MSNQTQRIKRVLGPLSKPEERRAVKVATTHFLKQVGDDSRFRLIDVGLRIEKPEGLKQIPSRIVQVVFANYSDRRNVAVLVDAKGKVLQDECSHINLRLVRRSGPRRVKLHFAMNVLPQ
jgi:hypothetical protein